MFRADALSVCRALLPTWSGVLDARLEPITGGITNTLRIVVPSSRSRDATSVDENGTNEPSPPEPVVLRVFGRGTEAFLDRDTENAALAELNKLQEIAPKEASVFFLMGRIYKKLGLQEKAMINFSIALDLRPSNADVNSIKGAIEKLDADELSDEDNI